MTGSEDDNSQTPPKKTKLTYKQKYCVEWESVIAFKGWLTSSKKGNI